MDFERVQPRFAAPDNKKALISQGFSPNIKKFGFFIIWLPSRNKNCTKVVKSAWEVTPYTGANCAELCHRVYPGGLS